MTSWERKAPDHYWKQGDSSPALERELEDRDGNTVDLDGASVRFIMWLPGAASAKINASATITIPDPGTVSFFPTPTQTDTLGDYMAEFEVTFGTGEVETFPNGTHLKIRVTEGLA